MRALYSYYIDVESSPAGHLFDNTRTFNSSSSASMADSEAGRGDGKRMRRRIGGSGLQARNTQAARDALRRRQKEKKARIVKRHVRYKEKKKLLEQLERSERPAPIVAKELCRDDEEYLEGRQESPAKARTPDVDKEDGVEDSASVAENDQRKGVFTEKGDEDQTARTDEAAGDGASDDDSIHQDKPAKIKKYVPFMKEQKEYERIRQEREAEMKARRQKIEEREQMLHKSKKQRRAKAKQVRKITPRGQPKLKYQLDAILERIQKQ